LAIGSEKGNPVRHLEKGDGYPSDEDAVLMLEGRSDKVFKRGEGETSIRLKAKER